MQSYLARQVAEGKDLNLSSQTSESSEPTTVRDWIKMKEEIVEQEKAKI